MYMREQACRKGEEDNSSPSLRWGLPLLLPPPRRLKLQQEVPRSSADSVCVTRLCPFHCSLEIQYPNERSPQNTKDIKVWGEEGV